MKFLIGFWIILLLNFSLMFTASRNESAIMDELAHLPAGYSYIKYFDYRLNPEHPPLVKAFSALPLLLIQNLNFPLNHRAWREDVNGQWEIGAQFLYREGNDADQMINYARIFPMLLTLLTIILIYIWSKELIGPGWALLPSFLFGLSPTVLAHGHYITTDIGAAFGALLAIFFFTKTLVKPTSKNIIISGAAFGLAQLTKFSNVLLVPYFIILTLIFAAAEIKRNRLNFVYLSRLLKICFLIFIIGLILIYAVYFLLTLNYPPAKQLADAEHILRSFSISWLAQIDLTMIRYSILRPLGEYLLGVLMVMQRSMSGNTSYFLGEVSAGGWWYYFPLVFLLKEPLPSLILILLVLVLSFLKFKIKNLKFKNISDYIGLYFNEFSMLLFVFLYWLYSLNSPLNIGVRHLLPTLPFIYILTAAGLKSWLKTKTKIFSFSIKTAFILILIGWFAGEIIFAYPYFLSYFNQVGGGVKNGWHYVTDSNYDWGQDLKRLKNLVEEKNIQKIGVDYFGGGDPRYYLGDKFEPWWSARGHPLTNQEQNPQIEWLAISINTLQNATAKPAPGFERRPEDSYEWLKEVKPAFRAGTSIFVYKF